MPDRRPLHERVFSSHDLGVAVDAFLERGDQISHVLIKKVHIDLFLCEYIPLRHVQVAILIVLCNEHRRLPPSLEIRAGRENLDSGPQPSRYDIASLLIEERERVLTREGLALLEETNKKR